MYIIIEERNGSYFETELSNAETLSEAVDAAIEEGLRIWDGKRDLELMVADQEEYSSGSFDAETISWSKKELDDLTIQFQEALDQIMDECEAEGLPSTGSTFELRAGQLADWYAECYPQYGYVWRF